MTDTIAYPRVTRVCYREGPHDVYVFIPVCPKCGRFVRPWAGGGSPLDGEPGERPNATCSRCGSVTMRYEGKMEAQEGPTA